MNRSVWDSTVNMCRTNPRRIAAVIALVMFGISTACAASPQRESPWEVSIGAGVTRTPRYEGAEAAELSPVATVGVVWNDLVYLTVPEELGVVLYDEYGVRGSLGIGYDFGRDDHSGALRGLGEIAGAPTVNALLEYELGPLVTALAAKRFLGGSEGLEVSLDIEGSIPLRRRVAGAPTPPAIAPGVSVRWADDNYAAAYFGIDADQSARSGLPRHAVGAGVTSVGGRVAAVYPLGARISANVAFEYSRLIGEVAASPIAGSEHQYLTTVLVWYHL